MFAVGWMSAGARAQTESPPATVQTAKGTFGEGITLTTPDGSLSLNIRGRVQTRATVLAPSVREGDDAFADSAVSEIAIRRARLVLSGHAFGPKLTYYVQLAFSNQDTESDVRLPLRDAYGTWAATRDLQVQVGQAKVPYGRQRVTSSSAQQFVDRSIVTGELNLDRDVGVSLLSKDLGGLDGRFGYQIGVYGGDGRNRLGEAFGYLGAARVMIRPMGGFDDNVEADVERHETPKLSIGGGFAYNENTNRPRSTIDLPYEAATFDYAHVGADLMFKWHGLFVQGEWFLRSANTDAVTTGALTEYSRSGTGWYAQAGQLFGSHFELAARYGDLLPAKGTDPDFERQREVGAATSWYFQEHALKLQADYFYLPKGDSFDGGDHQVRAQFQLYF